MPAEQKTKHQVRNRRGRDIYKEYLNLARQHPQASATAGNTTREDKAIAQPASLLRTEAPAPKQKVSPPKSVFSSKNVIRSIRRIMRGREPRKARQRFDHVYCGSNHPHQLLAAVMHQVQPLASPNLLIPPSYISNMAKSKKLTREDILEKKRIAERATSEE
ncbi:unnamed protein product [Callosobruchus maculatus]|uniref:Uncharacterized protein n=1 Tax=Callosobruchus maculatus TaxID=64391 RepID=A0A653BDU5_CALMS|nr:unnamed protein product [Callosobruchus maculatus]